jgi:hypothetical protein
MHSTEARDIPESKFSWINWLNAPNAISGNGIISGDATACGKNVNAAIAQEIIQNV